MQELGSRTLIGTHISGLSHETLSDQNKLTKGVCLNMGMLYSYRLRKMCFFTAGINESYQMGLFQVLAAILHLGNVEIKDRDADSSIIPVSITEILQDL